MGCCLMSWRRRLDWGSCPGCRPAAGQPAAWGLAWAEDCWVSVAWFCLGGPDCVNIMLRIVQGFLGAGHCFLAELLDKSVPPDLQAPDKTHRHPAHPSSLDSLPCIESRVGCAGVPPPCSRLATPAYQLLLTAAPCSGLAHSASQAIPAEQTQAARSFARALSRAARNNQLAEPSCWRALLAVPKARNQLGKRQNIPPGATAA